MPHNMRIESSFPNEPPQKTEGVRTKRSSMLVDRVRSLFSWIASWAPQEARAEVERAELAPQVKQTLSVHLSGDLLQRAEKSVYSLDLAREELLSQCGHQGHAFVERYVDPVLVPAHELLAAARSGAEVDVSRWAVAGVEMISLIHDEARLQRRIYDFCLEKTREALVEDVAFIASCPQELINDSEVPAQKRPSLLKRIEADLRPLLDEFEKLLTHHPRSPDLKTLFGWKFDLDEERQRLHDLSLTAIDQQIQRATPLWRAIQSGREEAPFDLDSLASEVPSWPLSVFELEETSTRLREVLEAGIADRADERVVAFFDRMRGSIQELAESEEVHDEALLRLKDHVLAIERLLGLRPPQAE